MGTLSAWKTAAPSFSVGGPSWCPLLPRLTRIVCELLPDQAQAAGARGAGSHAHGAQKNQQRGEGDSRGSGETGHTFRGAEWYEVHQAAREEKADLRPKWITGTAQPQTATGPAFSETWETRN